MKKYQTHLLNLLLIVTKAIGFTGIVLFKIFITINYYYRITRYTTAKPFKIAYKLYTTRNKPPETSLAYISSLYFDTWFITLTYKIANKPITTLYSQFCNEMSVEFEQLVLEVSAKNSIIKPPGLYLMRITKFVCSPKTVTQIFEPFLADLQYEYFEAIKQKKDNYALWIRIRYFIAFLKLIGLWNTVSICKQIYNFWKNTH